MSISSSQTPSNGSSIVVLPSFSPVRTGARYFVGELPFYDGKMVFPLLGIRRYSEDGGAHWGYTFPYFIYYSFGFGGD